MIQAPDDSVEWIELFISLPRSGHGFTEKEFYERPLGEWDERTRYVLRVPRAAYDAARAPMFAMSNEERFHRTGYRDPEKIPYAFILPDAFEALRAEYGTKEAR